MIGVVLLFLASVVGPASADGPVTIVTIPRERLEIPAPELSPLPGHVQLGATPTTVPAAVSLPAPEPVEPRPGNRLVVIAGIAMALALSVVGRLTLVRRRTAEEAAAIELLYPWISIDLPAVDEEPVMDGSFERAE